MYLKVSGNTPKKTPRKSSKKKVKDFDPLKPQLPASVACPIKFLEQKGLTVEGIFRIPGDAGAIKAMRKELDRGKASKFDKVSDPHLAAGVLKSFLIDMDEPLFTYEISDSFLKATEIADTFLKHECLRQALEQLPPGHKVIAEALVGLFYKVIQNHGKNKMDANNLATIFAPSLISRSRDNSIQQILMDMVPASRVLHTLITYYEQIFLNKPLPGEEDQGPQSKKQEQVKAFQNSLRTGTLRYASNLIKKERERINSDGGHRRQSSMIETSKDKEITDPILIEKLQKKRGERKHAKEIFGPISESPLSTSPSETTTDSPRSDSSKDKDPSRLRSSSSAITSSSDKNRIIPVLKKQTSTGSNTNDSPPDSAKGSPRKSSVVPKLDITKERKPHRSQTEQGLKKPKGAERRMSSLPGKTHSRKQSLRHLDKIQSQMNQLREQKQQLLTRAASASTPSSPRGNVNTNTNNKEETKSTPASPTSTDMMSPRRSSLMMNTNQDVASFLSALISQNGSIDDVDEYLGSPRSDVSSNGSGLDDDYDWAYDDDSEDEISSASSSTVGTDSPNSPRIFYNENVDVPKLVEECYKMVVDGKLSEVPTVLEKENVSPEKLTVIYDLLDAKLEKLAAETEAK